jgi:hypothetical protein
MPEVPPFEGTLSFVRKDVPLKATPFPMTQVRLLPGIYHDAQEWNRGYMARLTADRLLYNFRANAGLPVGSAPPLGGWEQKDNQQRAASCAGHFTGHFLSASALLYASTGDKEAKAKGDYMVAELAKCQEKLGGGYLSASRQRSGIGSTKWIAGTSRGRLSTPSTRSWPACSICTSSPATNRRYKCSRAWPAGPISGPPPKPKRTCRRS